MRYELDMKTGEMARPVVEVGDVFTCKEDGRLIRVIRRASSNSLEAYYEVQDLHSRASFWVPRNELLRSFEFKGSIENEKENM